MPEESNLVLPFNKNEEPAEDAPIEINYTATEADEEKFLLMYHMKLGVADVDSLDDDRRRWILARFMGQKQMEREAYEQHAMMQALNRGGGLKLPT